MWTSLAVASLLALATGQPPSPGGALALTNDRLTYGELGGPRADNKFLPGDICFLCFDIENISMDPSGKVQFNMSVEYLDAAGKAVGTKQPPIDRDEFFLLGGSKMTGRAIAFVGGDQPAGQYTFRVTVTDRVTKKSATLEKKFEVLPKTFGLVGLFTAADERGSIPSAPTAVYGSALFIHFSVVHFQRDAATKQPNVVIEMRVLDETGAPTVAKPAISTLTQLDSDQIGEPFRLLLPLNRAGKFTVELTATDKVANKTSKLTLPVTVLPASAGK